MINSGEKAVYLKYLQESMKKALAVGCQNLVIYSDALDHATGNAKKMEKEISFESRLINMCKEATCKAGGFVQPLKEAKFLLLKRVLERFL